MALQRTRGVTSGAGLTRMVVVNFTAFAIVGALVLAGTALLGHVTWTDVTGMLFIVAVLTFGSGLSYLNLTRKG